MKKIFLVLLITIFLTGITNAVHPPPKSLEFYEILEPNEIAIELAKSTKKEAFGTAMGQLNIKIKKSMMWSMIEQNKLLTEQNKLLKELIITLKKNQEK